MEPLYKGHLSNEDTVCSTTHIELCTNLPLNPGHLSIQDSYLLTHFKDACRVRLHPNPFIQYAHSYMPLLVVSLLKGLTTESVWMYMKLRDVHLLYRHSTICMYSGTPLLISCSTHSHLSSLGPSGRRHVYMLEVSACFA